MGKRTDNANRKRPPARRAAPTAATPSAARAYRVREWERIYGTSLWPPERTENTLIRQRQAEFAQKYVRIWVNDDPRGRVQRAEIDGQYSAILDAGGYELFGIAVAILRVAADSRTFRGCLVDWLDLPLDPAGIARRLGLPRQRTEQMLRTLLGPDCRFLELVEWPPHAAPPAGPGNDPSASVRPPADDAAAAGGQDRTFPVGRDGGAPEPHDPPEQLPSSEGDRLASRSPVGCTPEAGQAPGGTGPPGPDPPGRRRATVPNTVPTRGQGQGQGKGEGAGKGPKAKGAPWLGHVVGKRENIPLGGVGSSRQGEGEVAGAVAGAVAGPAAGPQRPASGGAVCVCMPDGSVEISSGDLPSGQAATQPPDGTATGAADVQPTRPPVPSDARPGGRPAGQGPLPGRTASRPPSSGPSAARPLTKPPDGTATGAAGEQPPAPGRADCYDRDLWRECLEHGTWQQMVSDAGNDGKRFGRVVAGLLGYGSKELGVRGLNSEVSAFARLWLTMRQVWLPEGLMLDMVQRGLRKAISLREQYAAGKYAGQKRTAISRVWTVDWRERVAKTVAGEIGKRKCDVKVGKGKA